VRPLFQRLTLAAIATVSTLAPAHAYCVEETSPIALGNQSIPIRSFKCGAERQREQVVKVVYHRLSTPGASLLLDGRSSTTLEKILGRPKLARTAPGDEFAALLREFGRDKAITANNSDSVGVRMGGEDLDSGKKEIIEGAKVVELEHDFDVPAIALNAEIKQGTAWPSRYGLQYEWALNPLADLDFVPAQGPAKTAFRMSLWTFLTQQEMDAYERERDRYNTPEILGRRFGDRRKFLNEMHETLSGTVGREFEFERKIARGRLPQDFALIKGSPSTDACASPKSLVCCWAFTYYPRQTALDVMVVENITQKAVRLERILGDIATQGLRPIGAAVTSRRADGDQMQPLGVELQPGERAAVPLRMVLLPPEVIQDRGSVRKDYADMETEIRSRISAMPPGTMFQLGKGTHRVRKTKESFRPWTAPKMQTYIYGPELLPSGLRIDGQPMGEEPLPTKLSIENESGSCPYLASWDGEQGRWTDHGKVLDKAKGKDLRQADTRTFQGFKSRFLLSEIEPEVAYIDQAVLDVTLNTGKTLALQPLPVAEPPRSRVAGQDGDYAVLLWGDKVEIRFALPAGIAEADVVTSALTLTGYYERYATLASQAAADEEAKNDRKKTTK
jgi:hypothetical protein